MPRPTMKFLLTTLFLLSGAWAMAQEVALPDTTNQSKPLKVDHAEPLYVDLIRDLGPHKGEKEWNIGAV